MTTSAQARTNIFGFFSIVVLSAVSMLWLLWRHPVSTGIAAIAVLGAFAFSARLARLVDTEGLSELQQSKQRA